jgi:hypothetical protein
MHGTALKLLPVAHARARPNSNSPMAGWMVCNWGLQDPVL